MLHNKKNRNLMWLMLTSDVITTGQGWLDTQFSDFLKNELSCSLNHVYIFLPLSANYPITKPEITLVHPIGFRQSPGLSIIF